MKPIKVYLLYEGARGKSPYILKNRKDILNFFDTYLGEWFEVVEEDK